MTVAAVLISFLLGTTLVSQSVAQATDDRPNLVLVLNDDVSAIEYDFLVGPGQSTLSGAVTPTLNMMVQQGVSFLTAWSMPICGPTRGSLVTGLYAQVTGWRSNQKPDGSLGTLFGTFGTVAKDNGYKVLIAGKWQMEGEVETYGYEEACLWQTKSNSDKSLKYFKTQYIESGGLVSPDIGPQANQGSRFWRPFIVRNGELVNATDDTFGPDVIFDCAIDFITRQQQLGNKFLVYLPTLLAHADYDFDIDDGKFNHYLPVPSRDAQGQFLGREPGPGSLKRNIEYQDYLMKKLLDHIASLGLEKDTITFFLGDNGTLGYGKKKLESEKSTRVPFVVYGPGRVQARGSSRRLVSTNDIYATFVTLMRATVLPSIPRPHSVDLSSYLLGLTNSVRRRWLYGILEDDHLVRSPNRIYDGNQDLWQCPERDERTCVKVDETNYTTADQVAVSRFQKIICMLEANMTLNNARLVQPGSC